MGEETAQALSDGANAAQQGQPLLSNISDEPAQGLPNKRSNLIKRKPVPNSTSFDYRPAITGPANNDGQRNIADHAYAKIEDAQELSPAEAAFAINARERSDQYDADTDEIGRPSASASGNFCFPNINSYY